MISPLYGQLSPLRIPTRAPRVLSSDADANTYLLAVEAADGQQLENGVITAVETFVVGCKSDGIWSAIKASCILAGARTLSGALVPLVGTAPTNFNFVAADYNRETGLKANGATKYLNSNRNSNADPQNNHHMSVFYSEPEVYDAAGKFTMGAAAGVSGATHFGRRGVSPGTLFFRNRNITLNDSLITADLSNTFCGTSRETSAGYRFRYNGTTQSITRTSETPFNGNLGVFRNLNVNGSFSGSRLSFYSIGESLDLAALDNRVSTLMTALAAAI